VERHGPTLDRGGNQGTGTIAPVTLSVRHAVQAAQARGAGDHVNGGPPVFTFC
jgi:hypothetical protein